MGDDPAERDGHVEGVLHVSTSSSPMRAWKDSSSMTPWTRRISSVTRAARSRTRSATSGSSGSPWKACRRTASASACSRGSVPAVSVSMLMLSLSVRKGICQFEGKTGGLDDLRLSRTHDGGDPRGRRRHPGDGVDSARPGAQKETVLWEYLTMG